MFRNGEVRAGILTVLVAIGCIFGILSVQAGSNGELSQSEIETKAVKQAEDFHLEGPAQIVASKKTTEAEAIARLDPSQSFSTDPNMPVWIVILKGKVTFYGPPAPDTNGKIAASGFTYEHLYELIDNRGTVIEWGGLSDEHIPDLKGPVVSVYPSPSTAIQTQVTPSKK